MAARIDSARAADRWLRRLARGLVLAWGVGWIGFSLAAAWGERATEGPGAVGEHLSLALLVLIFGAVAWLGDLPGGLSLLAVAGLGQWLWRPDDALALALTFPPALAGVILLVLALAEAPEPPGPLAHHDPPSALLRP